MSDYKFAGINVYTYDTRATIWFGKSGYGEQKHRIQYERGRAEYLGLNVKVGGEDGEITLYLGLLFVSFYIGVTGLVKCNQEKLKAAAKHHNGYTYDIDYTDNGVKTGFEISFKPEIGGIHLWLWRNWQFGTSRSSRQKMKAWPYCEGLLWSLYFDRYLGWQYHDKAETEVITGDYTIPYTNKSKTHGDQNALVKLSVETRHYRRFRFMKKTVRSIWVEFNREMGERIDTWKGGTIATGINMMDGETAHQALARMQKTREL